MLTTWHLIVHVMGVDAGLRYGKWSWYGFWSGFGGTILFSSLVIFPGWYYQRTCHDHPLCLRWGKYEAAGGMFRLCRRHHPDLQGQRPHGELIRRLHREHKERQVAG